MPITKLRVFSDYSPSVTIYGKTPNSFQEVIPDKSSSLVAFPLILLFCSSIVKRTRTVFSHPLIERTLETTRPRLDLISRWPLSPLEIHFMFLVVQGRSFNCCSVLFPSHFRLVFSWIVHLSKLSIRISNFCNSCAIFLFPLGKKM